MSNQNNEENTSKKDGTSWFKQLQKEKHAETVATVKAAMAKPENERTGTEFLAAHRLEVAEHEKSFKEKSRLETKPSQKSEFSK